MWGVTPVDATDWCKAPPHSVSNIFTHFLLTKLLRPENHETYCAYQPIVLLLLKTNKLINMYLCENNEPLPYPMQAGMFSLSISLFEFWNCFSIFWFTKLWHVSYSCLDFNNLRQCSRLLWSVCRTLEWSSICSFVHCFVLGHDLCSLELCSKVFKMHGITSLYIPGALRIFWRRGFLLAIQVKLKGQMGGLDNIPHPPTLLLHYCFLLAVLF